MGDGRGVGAACAAGDGSATPSAGVVVMAPAAAPAATQNRCGAVAVAPRAEPVYTPRRCRGRPLWRQRTGWPRGRFPPTRHCGR